MDKIITSRFLRINCPKCKVTRIIFGKSSLRVKCSRCNHLLIETSGGKAKIKAPVREIL